MKNLYAPWREKYTTEVTNDDPKRSDAKEDCVFCQHLADQDDEKHLILGRYEHNFVIVNKYPYNAGHLLILPFEHTHAFEKLKPTVSNELMELMKAATAILREELKSAGTNVGFNLGKAAGAGIPGHLHAHILPRWNGDTNFLPTLAQTKQISADIFKMYERLKPHFNRLKMDSKKP